MVHPHPHAGQAVIRRGPAIAQARAAVVLVHGRGDSAAGILGLADEFDAPGITWIAPNAAGNTWYPYSFLAPIEQNEPYLSSALQLVGSLVEALVGEGMAHERIVLMGF